MKKSEFYNKVKQLIGSEPDRMLFSIGGRYLLAEGSELVEGDPEEVINWSNEILHFHLVGTPDDPPDVFKNKTVNAVRVSDFGLAENIVKAILKGDESEMITTVPGSERVLITNSEDPGIPKVVILRKMTNSQPVQKIDPFAFVDEMPEPPEDLETEKSDADPDYYSDNYS